jgi:peptidyl-prolyl cis-trans isomerase C
MKWRHHYSVLLCMIAIGLVFACSSKPKSDDKIILKVDQMTMTLGQLNWQYLGAVFNGPEDEYQKKSAYLKRVYDKKLIADVGLDLGLADSVTIDSATQAQLLIGAFYQEKVASKIKYDDSDIRRFWDKYNGVIRVAQIVVETQSLAENLYQTLQKEPQKFTEYAGQFSIDQATKDKGGVIDSLRAGKLKPEFEDVAFSLKPDEISKPFETKFGWHIVKLISRERAPDQDYPAEKANFEKLYLTRLQEEAKAKLQKKLVKEENLALVDKTLDRMRIKLDSLRAVDQAASIAPRVFLTSKDLTREEMELPFARTSYVTVRAIDYVNYFRTWGLPKKADLLDKQFAETVVTQMTFSILAQFYAMKIKIQDTPQYQWQLNDVKMALIYRKMLDRINSSITVSEQEIKDYYSNYSQDFMDSAQVRVSEIMMASQPEAETIARQLRQGTPFAKLAAKTIRKGMAEKKGDLGYLGQSQYGEISRQAYQMKKGQISDPIQVDGGFSVIQVSDLRPVQPKPLAAVTAEIRDAVTQEKLQAALTTMVNEQKKKVENFVDFDLLKANLTTGKSSNAN